MSSCSVVILNWNGKHLLERFLGGVVAHSAMSGVDVVVADNASTDGSVEWVKKNIPEVKIILLDKNYGFTGGYNRAIAQLKSDYIVLLNSDIEVKERWLEPLIELLDKNPNTVAAMTKILSQLSPTEFEYAGACGGFIDKYHFPFCRGRILSNVEQDLGQYDSPREVFWASGAAMIIRREQFYSCGGFDEDFFTHMEEIDLCWRLQNLGYKIVVEPSSRVFHVGGATLSYNSPRKLFYNFRNNLYMIHKNTLTKNYKKVILSRMFIDGLLAMGYLLMFKTGSFRMVIRAHNAYRAEKPSLDKKRQENISLGCKPLESNIYPHWIVISYLLGKKVFSKLKF